jgi:hypothetical protein
MDNFRALAAATHLEHLGQGVLLLTLPQAQVLAHGEVPATSEADVAYSTAEVGAMVALWHVVG